MKINTSHYLGEKQLADIVSLHATSLKDSQLNRFPKAFVRLFFRFVSRSPNNILLVCKQDSEIVGYLLATRNRHEFLGPLTKLLEIGHTASQDAWPDAELQFIAINNSYQSRGWGSLLVNRLSTILRREKKASFIVGTRQDNPRSNHFYQKLNFQPLGQRTILGNSFNYYLQLL